MPDSAKYLHGDIKSIQKILLSYNT